MRTLKLDIYSHHFILSGVDSFYDRVIQEFARRLVEVKVERDRWGNVRGESIHVYAVRHQFDLAYRFHINHLYELDEHFKSRGLELPQPTKHPLYEPLEANFEVKKGWAPRDDQKHVVEYLVRPGTKKVVDAQTGSGKGLLHGTPVRTIDGWTPIEDISVGDRVMGETGDFHIVTGVFPQGEQRLYKVTFADDRIIITDSTHLWEVKVGAVYLTCNTHELMGYISNGMVAVTPTLIRDGDNPEYDPRNYDGTIVSVEKLDTTGQTTCISVNNPRKLFVTKDYIVTHNTIMTLFAIADINQRVAMVIKPMYISRWMDVLVGKDKFFSDKVKGKDIMTVRGSAQMASLINLGLAGELDASFIIISNRTYINYINHYKENGPSEEYGWVYPEDLWKILGVGVRLIDEAHQDFFGCFLTDLYSHVPKSIELSGSLEPDSDFLSKMYQVMYPKELRMNTGVTKRYADMIALYYSLDLTRKPLRTTRRGRSSYSQAAYEESILKSTVALRRLKDMMHFACEEFFMSERVGDNKLLVFFDTVNMCAEIADTFQELYPDLFVSKYTQEEDPSVLDEADIIIATPASAGTAVDIDGLQQVHSFVLRSSTQALIQMFGRLRQLATKEVTPKYYYFMTNDITAHQRYHQKALQVFQFRAKTHTTRMLPHVI